MRATPMRVASCDGCGPIKRFKSNAIIDKSRRTESVDVGPTPAVLYRRLAPGDAIPAALVPRAVRASRDGASPLERAKSARGLRHAANRMTARRRDRWRRAGLARHASRRTGGRTRSDRFRLDEGAPRASESSPKRTPTHFASSAGSQARARGTDPPRTGRAARAADSRAAPC